MHRSRKEALAYARCKLSPAVGRMMHRGGKERLLDVSCLQPLAEGCAKVGRKRLLTHVTRHLTHVTRHLAALDPCYAALDPCYPFGVVERCREVGRKRLQMLDASCLPPLADR
jgi:hypothetical protein